MMKSKLTLALLTISTLLMTSITTVKAQEEEQQNISQSTLSLQQKNEIIRVRENADQALVSNISQLRQLRIELSELMVSATASENDVQEKYRQIRLLSQEIMDNEFQARLKIRNILPPELRAPFAQQLNEALRNASTNQTAEN